MHHAKLYSKLLQAKKEGTFDSPGLPPGGSVISASMAPQRTGGEREVGGGGVGGGGGG